LEVARLPIWYLQRPIPLAKFLAVARRAGISNISEGQTLDAWAAKQAKAK